LFFTAIAAPFWFGAMFATVLGAIAVLFACSLPINHYEAFGIADAAAILALLIFGLGLVGPGAIVFPLISTIMAGYGAYKDPEGSSSLSCAVLGF